MNIQNLRLYAAGTNLFTITGWKGGDPETGQTLVADILMVIHCLQLIHLC